MPTFEPQKWNDGYDGDVQTGNNCYDYAIDRPSGKLLHKSQPGRAHGHVLSRPCTCEDVTEGALKDGLIASSRNDECPTGCWKVALAVNPTHPETDYHWYRQDGNGQWSHKPGWNQATNLDDSSQVINDPETADRGLYTDFCRYFCACPMKVTVA